MPLNLITIPAGNFLMGSDPQKGEAVTPDYHAWSNEYPQHSVFISEFQISETPITIAQYKSFVDAAGYEKPFIIAYYERKNLLNAKLDHPITGVDWFDAYAFCIWTKTRLPTEAEWEKAARGLQGQIYPWGNDPPDETRCNFGQGDGGVTTPVKQYSLGISPLGVYDMCGNVWEWTSTLALEYPYTLTDVRENTNLSGERIVRGGSFELTAQRIRCASRCGLEPSEKGNYIGFRVVLPRQYEYSLQKTG